MPSVSYLGGRNVTFCIPGRYLPCSLIPTTTPLVHTHPAVFDPHRVPCTTKPFPNDGTFTTSCACNPDKHSHVPAYKVNDPWTSSISSSVSFSNGFVDFVPSSISSSQYDFQSRAISLTVFCAKNPRVFSAHPSMPYSVLVDVDNMSMAPMVTCVRKFCAWLETTMGIEYLHSVVLFDRNGKGITPPRHPIYILYPIPTAHPQMVSYAPANGHPADPVGIYADGGMAHPARVGGRCSVDPLRGSLAWILQLSWAHQLPCVRIDRPVRGTSYAIKMTLIG